MVEKDSDGHWFHAPNSTAAQCVRDAVIKTRAPLEIWNNEKLKDEVTAERSKIKPSLTSSVVSHPVPTYYSIDDEDSELEQLAKRMEELKKSREKKIQEIGEDLKLRERELIQLIGSEKDASADFESVKESEMTTRLELEEQKAQLIELQTKINKTESKFRTVQIQLSEKSEYLMQVQRQITENKVAIDRMKSSLSRKSLETSFKTIQEDRDFQKAKATSLEEAAEIMKEETDLHVICNICNERQKDSVIQCGHRACNICLDEWRRKNDICPFCKATIQQVIRLFN